MLQQNHTDIRVMIVDDHPLVIQGLRRIIEGEKGLQVVAEVNDGEQAVSRASALQPDVILMDVGLPRQNGLMATKEIKKLEGGDGIQIIILTAHNLDEQLFEALYCGASAYFPKNVHPGELLPAIQSVADNNYIVGGQTMSQKQAYHWLAEQMDRQLLESEDREYRYTPLSRREMEILSLVTGGMNNKEIAHFLDISRQTVKNHMSKVLRKLGADDRTQAAVKALRRGLVRLDDLQPVGV